MGYVYCTSCGAKAEDRQRFCGHCGVALDTLQAAEPVKTITIPVVYRLLGAQRLTVHAMLTYAAGAKTVELVDDTSAHPTLRFDFNVDGIIELLRFDKNTALLTALPKSAKYATMLQIEFSNEVAATAFVTAMPQERLRVTGSSESLFNVTTTGAWLIVIGISVVAYFYFYFSTVVDSGGEQIYNVGLMNDRTLGIIIGVGACIVGAVLMAFGRGSPGHS